MRDANGRNTGCIVLVRPSPVVAKRHECHLTPLGPRTQQRRLIRAPRRRRFQLSKIAFFISLVLFSGLRLMQGSERGSLMVNFSKATAAVAGSGNRAKAKRWRCVNSRH